jgi:hypothetical protein
VVLAVLWSTASAAEPTAVSLPDGVPADEWRAALALVGLTVGPTDSGPAVRLVDEGDTWTVHVRAADGRRRSASVPEPVDEEDREAVAALAHSLLRAAPDVALPALFPLPPRAPAPPVRAPAPPQARVTAPPPAAVPPVPPPIPNPPSPSLPAQPPWGVADRRPPDPVATWWPETHDAVASPPTERARPRLFAWTSASGGAALRPGQPAGPCVDLAAGSGLGWMRLGIGVGSTARVALTSVDPDVAVAVATARAELLFAPPGATLGAGVGVDRRSFAEADAVSIVAMPWVAATAGLPFALTGGWELGPWLAVAHDLRRVEVRMDGFQLGRLPTTTASVGVRASWRSR